MSKRNKGMIEYKVFNKKVTLAQLECPVNVIEEVENRCSYPTQDVVNSLDLHSDLELVIPLIFQGKAVCQEGEEFSEQAGKKLAKKKALFKYHEAMRKKYDQILTLMEHVYPEIEKLYEEHSDAAGELFMEHKNYCENGKFK